MRWENGKIKLEALDYLFYIVLGVITLIGSGISFISYVNNPGARFLNQMLMTIFYLCITFILFFFLFRRLRNAKPQ